MDKPIKPALPASKGPAAPRRRRMQFTIFGLMVLMFVTSIGFAGLSYLVRADQGETSAWPIATFMVVALPMLMMTVLSLGYSLRKWFKRR